MATPRSPPWSRARCTRPGNAVGRRLATLLERLGPILVTTVLATMCVVLVAAGLVGLFLLLNGGAGVMQDSLLYFLTGFAVIWTGVWLFLLFKLIDQAVRRP